MRYVLAILVLLAPAVLQAQTGKKSTLYGTAAIIDPGHGGRDPGSSVIFGGERVAENEYVYDVARRVERLAKAHQGLAFLTLKHDEGIRDVPANRILADNTNEKFALNGNTVVAGTDGLSTRLKYGNTILKKYPKQNVVWISIHFDVVGTRSDVDGVRIIYGKNAKSKALAEKLAQSFGKAGRMREYGPIAVSGDKRYGLRNLYVLNGSNHASAKVLVELGNFLNPQDLWRIRDPKVREAYALAIVEALEK